MNESTIRSGPGGGRVGVLLEQAVNGLLDVALGNEYRTREGVLEWARSLDRPLLFEVLSALPAEFLEADLIGAMDRHPEMLVAAARDGRTPDVKRLLNAGTDLGETITKALDAAARAGHFDTLLTLMMSPRCRREDRDRVLGDLYKEDQQTQDIQANRGTGAPA